MSTDRDTTRIVRSWLRTDEHESADRVLDAVLDRLDATPQRRATWWPARRFPEMNNSAKLALAAAAVVVAAFLGIRFLLPGEVGLGGPSASPTPVPIPLPNAVEFDPGTYVVADPRWTPVRFTFTAPAGWGADGEGMIRKNEGEPSEVGFAGWVITHVYGNACHWAGSLVEAGETADELASALSSQEERTTSGPTSVVFGGYSARRVELSVPADFNKSNCDGGFVRSWPDPGPDENGGWAADVGQTDVIHAADVNGERVVIVATYRADTPAADVAELEAILASIRFEPPGPTTDPDEVAVRDWVDAVNRADRDALERLMVERPVTDVTAVDRADAISYILDQWCPLTINGLERGAGEAFLMDVTFHDNADSTCVAGTPGGTSTIVIEVRDGKVSRIP